MESLESPLRLGEGAGNRRGFQSTPGGKATIYAQRRAPVGKPPLRVIVRCSLDHVEEQQVLSEDVDSEVVFHVP
jgi:hypothetical protein